MEICTGIKDIESLKCYIKAGATEFYCGVIDNMWLSKYNYIVPLNRRPWKEANFSSFQELKEAVEIAHSYGCKIFYTLNEHQYNDQQLELIKVQLENLIDMNIDAIIISDIGIIHFLRHNGFKNEIHMSTGGITFNKSTVELYRNKFAVNRVILPRTLSIKEINSISKDIIDVDYEIFIMNEGCTYIDGYCNFVHGLNYRSYNNTVKYNPPCSVRYNIMNIIKHSNTAVVDKKKAEDRLDRVLSSKAYCGICSLYLLYSDRIKSLKIVSRDSDMQKIVNDIIRVKNAISLCNFVDNFAEYRSIIQSRNCPNNIDNKMIYCYYPEVLEL